MTEDPSQKEPIPEESKHRRGIYLLPNLFTTSNLFAGFYSVVAAMSGRFEAAAIAIFVAMIMDSLDGRVARLTHTQTAFGAEYDSLSDMVAFGIAPALLTYTWSLSLLHKIGWVAAFIYVAGAALRLARFNTQVGVADKRYFQGLPSPAAAGVLAGFVWVCQSYGWGGIYFGWITLLFSIGVGLLMVSNIRYQSFKELDLKGKVPFVALLVLVLIFVLISIDPPQVLFGLFFIYALSGPVLTLRNLRRMKNERKKNS